MGRKFDKVFESVVSRFEVGGYLTGDVVKFRSNYKKSPTYLAMPTMMQQKVDEFATCGLNCRVTQVGDRLSGASAGNQHKTADNVILTIGLDQGGGRFIDKVVVSTDMVDLDMLDGFNLPPTPEEREIKTKTNIKPEPVEDDEDNITRVSDPGGPNDRKGKKNRPTQITIGEGKGMCRKKDSDALGLIYEQVVGKADRIDNRERQSISSALIKAGLDGNGRFRSVSQAVGVANQALKTVGFDLDMVSGDMILGEKGGRMLSFRYSNAEGADPFSENPEIENSRVSFNWEDLGRDTGFEVVAYAS